MLDRIICLYIEKHRSTQEITKETGDKKTVLRVIHMIDKSEYKRYQLPPGLKVSEKAFGSGRKFPLVKKLDYGV
ncbi:hypothetical protein ACFL6D_00170 [Spirochaetota bacterium]